MAISCVYVKHSNRIRALLTLRSKYRQIFHKLANFLRYVSSFINQFEVDKWLVDQALVSTSNDDECYNLRRVANYLKTV